jgi:uncharacterized membrane protein
MRPTGTLARDITSILLLIAMAGVVVGGGAPSRPAADLSAESTAAGGHDAVSLNGSFAEQAAVEEFDDVQLHIRIAPDRSATWSVKYRYRLADNETEQAFERTRQSVTNPPGVFIERMRNAAQRAAMRTGREMRVQNGSVSAFRSVPHGRFGVVEYRFTWTGFAATGDDGDVVVGDTLSGYPLAGNESLIVTWDDQFRVDEVAPEPNATAESTVRWDGPHDFVVEHPTLVLTTGTGGSALSPLTMVVGGLLTVAVVVVLVYGVGAGGLVAAITARGDGETEKEEEPPAELLSDEERVLRLVEENGGRMKQQEVKDALDWSRTKTSNVVNDLQEADKLEVYRLGRENTLALPGEMDV